MLFFHIFEIPSISNKTPSTSDEKPNASENLDFDKKNPGISKQKFWNIRFYGHYKYLLLTHCNTVVNTYYLKQSAKS